MKEVASGVAVAQVVIQKHQYWVWARVSLAWFPRSKIFDSGGKPIDLKERKRRFGKMDCFFN